MPSIKQFKKIALSIVLLVLSYGLIKSSLEVFKGQQRMEDLEKEVINLRNMKEKLEGDIEYKKTDVYIEEKARNDLNLIKPGESVYVISGPDSNLYLDKEVLSGSSKRVEEVKEDANWYKWFRLFF